MDQRVIDVEAGRLESRHHVRDVHQSMFGSGSEYAKGASHSQVSASRLGTASRLVD